MSSNKLVPTISFKTAWNKEADMFDTCYDQAMKINASGSVKKTDAKEMREWMKEARAHLSEMRQISYGAAKIAVQMATTPGAKELFTNPESSI